MFDVQCVYAVHVCSIPARPPGVLGACARSPYKLSHQGGGGTPGHLDLDVSYGGQQTLVFLLLYNERTSYH